MGLFTKVTTKEEVDVFNSEVFANFKRYLHVYMIEGNKCFLRFNSFDAPENKSLYDAPIIEEMPKHMSYYDVFLQTYKKHTGVEYRDEKSHSNGRDIVEPKVIIDTKNKTLIYILFVKDVDSVNMPLLKQDKFVYDWMALNEFLETIYSDKYVNRGDSYREFIVFSVSQLLGVGDYIKTLKYSSNNDI